MKTAIKFLENKILFYCFLFSACFIVFAAHYYVVGLAIYGDGLGYYTYLHSLYFDHDLDFRNEFLHKYNYIDDNKYDFIPAEVVKKTVNFSSQYTSHNLCMGLMFMPFYALADLFVLVFNAIGIQIVRNGYSDIYQLAVGAGSILYMILGLVLAEKTIINIYIESRQKLAGIVQLRFILLTVFLSTPLIYYGAVDVVNSHAASFFYVSAFFYILFKQSKNLLKKYLTLGFVAGISTMVRLQEVMLFLPLLCGLLHDLNRNSSIEYNLKFFKKINRYLLPAVFAFIAAISPMLLSWRILFGNILNQDYISPILYIDLKYATFMTFFGSLIHPVNGILVRTPILLILLISVFFLFKYLRSEIYILFSYFITQHLIIAFFGGWISASYGGRMYISTMPLFFLLAAKFYDLSRQKYTVKIITIASCVFILLNMASIFSFMVLEKYNTSNTRGIEKDTKIRIERIINKISSLI